MNLLYFVSIFLHILSATIWIGGIFFIMLVIGPFTRKQNHVDSSDFLENLGKNFRTVSWICLITLCITGMVNLHIRGVMISDLRNLIWINTAWGHVVILKIIIFVFILLNSIWHDFFIGKRSILETRRAANIDLIKKLKLKATLAGRINALLAVAILIVAIVLVRDFLVL